ncbi:glycosyltransferase family 2 protein [Microbacterium sp.]|uniref:glycosyltransferase family 2 protein n=1 Tax=Microbacterium sp. TaxID=51671 RepID=UPI0037C7E3A1
MALVGTVGLWLLYMTSVVVTLSHGGALTDAGYLIGTVVFLVSVAALTFSSSMYLLARVGALPRLAAHRRARRADIDERFDRDDLSVLALLPSYGEDPAYVRMALWSVSLQEVPGLRVVLLLDDPPSDTPEIVDRLARTRAIIDEIRLELSGPLELARDALDRTGTDSAAEARSAVATAYHTAARWIRSRADVEPRDGHVEEFFVERVLGALADELAAVAAALDEADHDGDEALPPARVRSLAHRLVRIFSAEVAVFERKHFREPSHEPTKAANLNAYLALVGGVHELHDLDGVPHIVDVPACDVVITLDADSMLLPEYAARLVYALEQPAHERVGVIQTPYSAYRGRRSSLERLAGATTDVQHLVHQGLTAFDATFWVGANAVIRWALLEDLRAVETVDGREVVRFIRGRTVIEDTESSIDVIANGWSLLNYPERLSYSSTPPDFGTLAVQRRRWANGGLLVLPALWRTAASRRASGHPMRASELLLRANYLGSIAWVTTALIVLLTVVPLNGELVSFTLMLMALPYFIEMAHDLRVLGYRRRDIFGVYGLNLLLVAVNIAGTLGSIAQAFTGQRVAFVRTPKQGERTPAGALLIVAPLIIAGGAMVVAIRSIQGGLWIPAAFAVFTALCVGAAVIRLIGIRAAVSDLWNGWLEWIWVPVERRAVTMTEATTPAWRRVLDDGVIEPVRA